MNLVSSKKMRYTGTLYITAGVLQCFWPYYIWQNWEISKQFLDLPILGWCTIGIWGGMLVVIPILIWIGIRFFMLSNLKITQTLKEKLIHKNILVFLSIGILLDIIFILLILTVNIPDISAILLLSLIMGGRILQANAETIFQYYGV